MYIEFIIMAIIAVFGLLANTGMKERAKGKRLTGKDDAMGNVFKELLPQIIPLLTGRGGEYKADDFVMQPLDPKDIPEATAADHLVKVKIAGVGWGESFWVKMVKGNMGIVYNELVESGNHHYRLGSFIDVSQYGIIDEKPAGEPLPEQPQKPAPKMAA